MNDCPYPNKRCTCPEGSANRPVKDLVLDIPHSPATTNRDHEPCPAEGLTRDQANQLNTPPTT